MKKYVKKLLAATLAALAVLAALGCSAKIGADTAAPSTGGYSGHSGEAGAKYYYAAETPNQNRSVAPDGGEASTDTRKIVKTVALDLETKDFDKGVSEIEELTEAAGGYVELSYISGRSLYEHGITLRSAEFTLRVPAAGLGDFTGALAGKFNVLSRKESSTDITDAYYDSKSQLDSLRLQEERLLAMLGEAGDLEYLLKLEDKLAEVRYKIDSLYQTIQRYDKAVEMATVNVTLSEVVEYQKVTEPPKTFGERLSQSFFDSWANFARSAQDFTVGLVYALPSILTLAAIAAIAALPVYRILMRKKARKKETDNSENK